MKILFISIAWPQKGERNLYKDLMDEFVEHGHQIFVVCSDHHATNLAGMGSLEDGIHVVRVRTLKIRKVGRLGKALALPLLGLQFRLAVNRHLKNQELDLILMHTPPVNLSGLMAYIKKKYRASFYLLLKDIWPHNQADLGLIRKKGLIWQYFRWHEKRIYKLADYIGCMSPKNVSYIADNNKYLDPGKIEVNPNSIRIQTKQPENGLSVRQKYHIPEEATTFIFSGNLSRGHNLEFLIESIHHLKGYKKAFFIIGGKGMYYGYLKRKIEEFRLTNAFLYYYLPEDDFNRIMSTSDVGLILLDHRYQTPQFPSRVLSYLESGKPVLCSVNKGTDIGEIIEKAGCGLSTPNNDMDAFIRGVKYFTENEALKDLMGKRSRALLENHYSTFHSYSQIISHFEKN